MVRIKEDYVYDIWINFQALKPDIFVFYILPITSFDG